MRYDDPDLANTLEKLGTYGSEYAVLAIKSKHLSLREKMEGKGTVPISCIRAKIGTFPLIPYGLHMVSDDE